MNKLIKILWENLSFNDKKNLTFVVFLTFLSSIFEIISIGMIIPLITVLIEPTKLLEYEIIKNIAFHFELYNPSELVLPIIFSFIVITIFSTFIRILSIKLSANFSFFIGSELSVKAYKNILFRSYEEHKNINSSEDISKLVSKINTVIQSLIFPFVMLLGAFVMFSIITVVFLSINFYLTVSILAGLVSIYLAVTFYFKSRLKENSKEISLTQDKQVQIVQESIGGIQDVILNHNFNYFINKYRVTDFSLRKSQSSTIIIAQMPKYLIESFSIVFLLVVSYYFTFINSIIAKEMILPIFITIAMALQRILPIAQQAYRSWANIEGNKQSLYDVLKLLEFINKTEFSDSMQEAISYNSSIEIRNLSFKYSQSNINSLNSISLDIQKGDKIGFIGTTGSGKSTLVDLIMGLLKSSDGCIKIDNTILDDTNIQSWYKLISHVPQNIYLLDGNIYENISFGVGIDNIDKDKVHEVGKLACIDEFISQKENGYLENVGERGSKLSGGQRQRIGIARALYKQSPIIVLDEATSALDTKTEEKIMNNIYSLAYNPTVIIIAHRLSTLRNCNKIVELKNGQINRIGSYQEIIGGKDEIQ